jgi:hypothetical protein
MKFFLLKKFLIPTPETGCLNIPGNILLHILFHNPKNILSLVLMLVDTREDPDHGFAITVE